MMLNIERHAHAARTAVGAGVCIALATTVALSLVALPRRALAADAAPATIETPRRDPWVPPADRVPSLTAPTRGADLRAQVQSKLEAAFATADVQHTGTLTRAQARAAGLGFIDRHFDDIDTRRSGVVRFDDVMRYIEERQATTAPR